MLKTNYRFNKFYITLILILLLFSNCTFNENSSNNFAKVKIISQIQFYNFKINNVEFGNIESGVTTESKKIEIGKPIFEYKINENSTWNNSELKVNNFEFLPNEKYDLNIIYLSQYDIFFISIINSNNDEYILCKDYESGRENLDNFTPTTNLNSTPLSIDDTEYPSKYDNFDWTYGKDISGNIIKYNFYINLHENLLFLELPTPWYSYSGPAYADFGTTIDKFDNSPEDGWELLAKDFGYEFREVSLLPKTPFFILYNSDRKKLRIFYFINYQMNPHTQGEVKLKINDGVLVKTLTTITEYQRYAWNYAEFSNFSFDPINSTYNSELTFTIDGVDITYCVSN